MRISLLLRGGEQASQGVLNCLKKASGVLKRFQYFLKRLKDASSAGFRGYGLGFKVLLLLLLPLIYISYI